MFLKKDIKVAECLMLLYVCQRNFYLILRLKETITTGIHSIQMYMHAILCTSTSNQPLKINIQGNVLLSPAASMVYHRTGTKQVTDSDQSIAFSGQQKR